MLPVLLVILAVREGHVPIVEFLLSCNVNVSYQESVFCPAISPSEEGNMAIHYAAERNDRPLIALLLQTNISLKTRNFENRAAVDFVTDLQSLFLLLTKWSFIGSFIQWPRLQPAAGRRALRVPSAVLL